MFCLVLEISLIIGLYRGSAEPALVFTSPNTLLEGDEILPSLLRQ